jgi:hypothetical protein
LQPVISVLILPESAEMVSNYAEITFEHSLMVNPQIGFRNLTEAKVSLKNQLTKWQVLTHDSKSRSNSKIIQLGFGA